MKKITIIIWLLLASYQISNAQYVNNVQKQVLFDVLRLRADEVLISHQDSLIHAYKKELTDAAKTVSSCQILNADYAVQISLLKKIGFDDKKEIIILNQDNKRLKRQNTFLKILIPVVVGVVIWLDH